MGRGAVVVADGGAATSTDAVTWSRDVSMSKDGPPTVPRGPRHKPLALNDSDRPARKSSKNRLTEADCPSHIPGLQLGLSTEPHVSDEIQRVVNPNCPLATNNMSEHETHHIRKPVEETKNAAAANGQTSPSRFWREPG
ncbi:unnamed protein product [Heligmosomoides polygyrus]|uniref:Uncharacterized protein n=1 Tax=Heligmosomoides polygyrus TaxID=6339 RepID=A0A183GH35_HELPZ|nr:unnamed protein product [Heligmosomoides polygyrus]